LLHVSVIWPSSGRNAILTLRRRKNPLALTFSHKLVVSTHSSVGMATGCTTGVRFQAREEDFCLIHSVQAGSGAHPASCPMGTGGSFPEAWSRPLTSNYCRGPDCPKLYLHYLILLQLNMGTSPFQFLPWEPSTTGICFEQSSCILIPMRNWNIFFKLVI
jgi:hypothetical protein